MTSTVLASGSLNTLTPTLGLPFVLEIEFDEDGILEIVATSFNKTGFPSLDPIAIFCKSSKVDTE